MPAAQRPPYGGIRVLLGCLALCLSGPSCTTPNPNFEPGTSGDGGGRGGSAGGGDGSGGYFGTGGYFNTGGAPGTGGGPPDAASDASSPGDDAAGDGHPMTDQIVPMDTSSPADGPPPLDGPPDNGTPSAVCGAQNLDLADIVGARGIAIDPTGVIYYAREVGNQAWIGRLMPGSTAEPNWITLPGNAQPRTLRLDSARSLLFVAATGTGFVYGITTIFTVGSRFVSINATLPGAHGLAVAEDGAVLVSLSNGIVMHLVSDLAQNTRTPTTTTAIFPGSQRPLGLAFGPSGHLFVGLSGGGIKRFVLRDKQLVEGTDHGQWTGSANDLAFDVEGRLYVADSVGSIARHVAVIPATGASVPTTIGTAGLLSGLAFGRGVLGCQDLYVTDGGGPARRLTTTALGLKLP